MIVPSFIYNNISHNTARRMIQLNRTYVVGIWKPRYILFYIHIILFSNCDIFLYILSKNFILVSYIANNSFISTCRNKYISHPNDEMHEPHHKAKITKNDSTYFWKITRIYLNNIPPSKKHYSDQLSKVRTV